MKLFNLKITILILSIFVAKFIFAQPVDAVKRVATISKHIPYTEDFSGAIRMYKQMLLFDRESTVFNYKLGFCYLNTFKKQDSSIIFLTKASQMHTQKDDGEVNKDEIDFYLARAYRVNSILDSAVIILERLKAKSHDKEFLNVIDYEISLALVEFHNEFDIENLGEIINSPFTEHSPVISEDKKTLMFTSRKRRNENSSMLEDGEYDEDIYIARRVDGKWTKPKPIKGKINTNENEASTSIACDGTQLFIYKEDKRGSIYYSRIQKDSSWSEPVKLGKNINTRHRETHATMTCDGRYLFFTSDRPGGYGGLDIYVSEKDADGEWGKAKNLGAGVNSYGDEEGPFIKDSTVLYFSSNGHKGFGNYDIFKSTKTEFATWGHAENLGYPINSINVDIYYVPIANTENAFYASYKSNGFGNTDIYLLRKDIKKEEQMTVNIGYVETCEGGTSQAIVNIDNISTGEHSVAKPNNIGRFIFVTEKSKDYKITVEYDGEIIFADSFNVPQNTPFKQHYQTIVVEDCVINKD